MTHPQLHIVCALVWCEEKVLITRRKKDAHLGGYWEFPGGKREQGEDDAKALVRELKEEVDLEIRVGELFYKTQFAYPEREVLLHFYTCTVSPGAQGKALEVAELKWIDPADIDQYPFPPANTELLEKLKLLGKEA